MSDISADALAKALFYLGDCVRFTESVRKQPCCNSCGKIKTCEYRPEWGEPTRINCPLWSREGESETGLCDYFEEMESDDND